MKEVHDINVVKNIGQFFVCPVIGIVIAVLAIKGGSITGYFAFLFGGLIAIGFTLASLVVYDKLIVQRVQESNERIQKAEKERLRKMIEEENDPDAYPEYDD